MIRWRVPDETFLDTGIVIAALFPGTPDSVAVGEFVDDLVHARSVIYLSTPLRLDFARALRRLATKPGKLPSTIRDQYELDRWGANPLLRQRWLTHGLRLFDDFLLPFARVVEVPLTDSIWRQSIDLMAAESLDATDAFHIAAARSAGVADFATTDRDFRRITTPRIHLIRDDERMTP